MSVLASNIDNTIKRDITKSITITFDTNGRCLVDFYSAPGQLIVTPREALRAIRTLQVGQRQSMRKNYLSNLKQAQPNSTSLGKVK